jgi:hypothetical protein
MVKEAITLQVGNYSNHVGAHYWNALQRQLLHQRLRGEGDDEVEQEEFVEARLFRCRRDGRIQPRVLVSDLKLNFGRQYGERQEEEEEEEDERGEGGHESVHEWSGPVARMVRRDLPDKNIFQAFLENCGAETYDGEQRFVVPRQGRLSSASTSPRPPETCIERWTDFSACALSQDVNVCALPLWTTQDTFDSFLSSATSVPREYIEMFMEKLRYMAEECDMLSTIQIFADIHDGFGSLAGRIAEDVREEYGRGINMPIFAFTDVETNRTEIDRDAMSNTLRELNVPYSYARLTEFASVVVPVSPAATTSLPYLLFPYSTSPLPSKYHSSSIVACAIDSAMGFQQFLNSTASPVSMDDWLYKVTGAGRFPLCELETAVPFPSRPSESPGHMNKLDNFFATTEEGPLNPFAHSLSSSTRGEFAVTERQGEYMRSRQRPFTNVINIRGPCHEGLPTHLFSMCDSRSDYLITSCFRTATPYRVPITFPHIFRGVDSHGSLLRAQRAEGQAQGTFCSSITTISAVGCDARMGSHLLRTANAWQRASSKGSVCAQLEKMDMSKGEAGEINETLVTAAQKYNASTEGL